MLLCPFLPFSCLSHVFMGVSGGGDECLAYVQLLSLSLSCSIVSLFAFCPKVFYSEEKAFISPFLYLTILFGFTRIA